MGESRSCGKLILTSRSGANDVSLVEIRRFPSEFEPDHITMTYDEFLTLLLFEDWPPEIDGPLSDSIGW